MGFFEFVFIVGKFLKIIKILQEFFSSKNIYIIYKKDGKSTKLLFKETLFSIKKNVLIKR